VGGEIERGVVVKREGGQHTDFAWCLSPLSGRCHPRAGGDPDPYRAYSWIPASAGMTVVELRECRQPPN